MGAHEDRNSKTSVQGGASAVPTPANNVNTGSSGTGLSDASQSGGKGAAEGGSSYQGPGHTSIPNPAASIGGFLGLVDQKGAAEAHMKQRVAESGGFIDKDLKNSGIKETCQTEDHSFMETKPGRPDALPGSSLLKGAVGRLTK
ncbi:conserved hypothetical protein [Talaromyces stipitatus ATCC 10500]|uniref:Uncharacterized protein n=1 Tax=Talaromyces stipitatus (strain ATCC 10500 / CBS 375.48 / QM 6759 / NRRL 1006) TaxID=441959 RepID=B8LYQ0_TALSN|nr:uncharacterized protein TSTA_068350 [Talaromyces stipitatus ATCC 10500]EED23408.1 conserved hypothetical protein [Talaromyces stipitatus ATCC 10500]